MQDVKKAVCLIIAMILVSTMLIGCDRLSDITGRSSNEKEPAPAAQVASPPTEIPVAATTEAPKAVPTEAPKADPLIGGSGTDTLVFARMQRTNRHW